jgi:hypothetical protein
MTTTPNPRRDAGYSGTPLPRKLGIGPGSRVVVLDAPTRLDLGVEVTTDLEGGPFDVLLLFCPDAARMAAVLPPAMAATAAGGRCWVAWPKRASKVPTDLTEDVVREIALAAQLVDNKVCAIDATWSGLRLVIRLADRPAAA